MRLPRSGFVLGSNNDGGAGVDHQLPRVGELKQWASDGPDENHDDSNGKGMGPATLSGRPLRGFVEQGADTIGHSLDVSATGVRLQPSIASVKAEIRVISICGRGGTVRLRQTL